MASRIGLPSRRSQLALESAGTFHPSYREKTSSRETLRPNRAAEGSLGPTRESRRASWLVHLNSISGPAARSIRHIAVEERATVRYTSSPSPAWPRRLDLSGAETWHETRSRARCLQKRFPERPSRRTL